jgi:uncharacterized protein YecT (DUF1311 family)
MKILPFLVVAGAVYVSAPCLAQVEVKFSSTYDKCMEQAAAVDPRMIECYGAEIALQDRRLNLAYRNLQSKLEPDRRKALVEVQRQWLRYTDANCDFYYDPNGGTAARMAANECSIRARSARATELEEFAKW